jgi:hypothetical protein
MGTPVTQTQQEIVSMLARKQLHGVVVDNYGNASIDVNSQHSWLMDAVELLLRIELERQA